MPAQGVQVRVGSAQPGQDVRRPPPSPGEELEVSELVGRHPSARSIAASISPRAARIRWGLSSVMTDMRERFRIGAAVVARLVRRGHAARWMWSQVQSIAGRKRCSGTLVTSRQAYMRDSGANRTLETLDVRAPPWRHPFDDTLLWYTTFSYFDEADNERVGPPSCPDSAIGPPCPIVTRPPMTRTRW